MVSSCSTGFQSSSQSVSYKTWDEGNGSRIWTIEGADPATFKALNGRYGKDQQSAYFKNKKIAGSHPESFTAISEIYAKDQHRVYYQDEPIPEADPVTFKIAQEDFGRDKNDIFLHARAIHACDPSSFKWLKSSWQVDSLCAYHRGNLIQSADPATFVPLDYFFAKDRRNVYSSVTHAPLDGVDQASFTVGTYSGSGKDKTSCYMFTKKVQCQE